jgi:hypothetical protein
MATLQSTSITGTLTVNGAAVASRSYKFQEFTSSGTFTPSSALISAGGVIHVFLVAGGGSNSNFSDAGSSGGEVLMKHMKLTNTTGCAVTIGAGGAAGTISTGGNSSFAGASAGGVNITASGGIDIGSNISNFSSPSYGGYWDNPTQRAQAGGQGVFGYGAGGKAQSGGSGFQVGKANSGQGAQRGQGAGSGYCLVTWFE